MVVSGMCTQDMMHERVDAMGLWITSSDEKGERTAHYFGPEYAEYKEIWTYAWCTYRSRCSHTMEM